MRSMELYFSRAGCSCTSETHAESGTGDAGGALDAGALVPGDDAEASPLRGVAAARDALRGRETRERVGPPLRSLGEWGQWGEPL